MRKPRQIDPEAYHRLAKALDTALDTLRTAALDARPLPQKFSRDLDRAWEIVWRLHVQLPNICFDRIPQD